MIAAILTGWLPGPGGIPLFIIGLSLLAINHTWAQRYIDLLKKYANKLGDLVFVENKRIQLLYDILAPCLVIVGAFMLLNYSEVWMLPIGIFLVFISCTLFLGNRHRWRRLTKRIKTKQ